MSNKNSDFLEEIQHIKEKFLIGLPGADSHVKALPVDRLNIDDYESKASKARQSAVLLLLSPNANREVQLTFILRANYNGTHGGQISFPGGKVELSDKSLEHTAIRETKEEIGVSPDQISVIGPMSWVYIPPSNFQVHPFLAYSTLPLTFTPEPREVAGVLSYPLSDLIKKEVFSTQKIKRGAINIETSGYQVEGNFIWGASAMILTELIDILRRS